MNALLPISVPADCFIASDLWAPRIDVDDLFWPVAWEQQPVSPVGSCDAVDMDIFASYLDDMAQVESAEPLGYVQFDVEALGETKTVTLKRKRVATDDQPKRKTAKTKAKTPVKSRKRVSTSVRVREEKKVLRSMIEQLQLELEGLTSNRDARLSEKHEEDTELSACQEATLALENACLRELVANQRTVIAQAESLITQSWQPLNVTLDLTLY